ncbi:MAG: zinc ribbon domain-containing protein [Chloroflexi bacterium]|nr:zinc ribbon domain-containing protein [Chloroflexota bacterium]
MVICRQCKTSNPQGSKFCNNCGAPLPPSTHLICPNCQSPNPRHLVYCDKCGARLLKESGLPQEETREIPPATGPRAFELPSRPPGHTSQLDPRHLPDWLMKGESKPPSGQGESGGAEESSIVGDWLSELSGLEEDKSSQPPQEESIPDWLQSATVDLETTERANDLPDWLQDLAGEKKGGEPAGGDLGDWLAEVESPAEEDVFSLFEDSFGEQETVVGQAARPEEVLPDWLSDLEAGGLEETMIAPAAAQPEEELPDWLSSLEAGGQPAGGLEETMIAPAATQPEEELPDWLSDLEAGGLEETMITPAAAQPEEEWAAWLGELEEPAASEPAGAEAGFDEEIPDWLDEARSESRQEEFISAFADDVEPAGEESVPDWLSAKLEEEPAETLLSLTEKETQEEMADWLTNLEAADETAQAMLADVGTDETFPDWLAEGDKTGAAAPPEDLGDWLKDFAPRGTGILSPLPGMEEEAAPEESLADIFGDELAPAEEVPDWLAGFAPPETSSAIPVQETAGLVVEPEEMPAVAEEDWLAELGLAETAEPAGVAAGPTLEEAPESTEELFDWLSQIEEVEEAAAPPAETIPIIPSPEMKGVPEQLAHPWLPEWMAGEEPESPLEPEKKPALAPAELPEWMQSLDEAEQEVARELTEGPALPSGVSAEEWRSILDDLPPPGQGLPGVGELAAPADLNAADIPAWLQALRPRPVGVVEEELEKDQPVQAIGPLAGLRGVIDIAPVVAEPRQAQRITPFTVTKEQQQQVALLNQLTSGQAAPEAPVDRRRGGTLSMTGRVLVSAFLLAAVVAGVLLARLNLATLDVVLLPAPGAARNAHDEINRAFGRPVLVAFDYTPAMAGELNAIARTVLDHLADNGNPVITVSQFAAGAAIADQVVADVEGLNSQSLNFLPGEAIGLRQLGSCLRSGCDQLIGVPLAPEMQASLANVGLIIILTGEGDSLVNWIEQVGKETDRWSMVVGVTQPLGPLVLPYATSEQVAGSIVGLPAAAAYEREVRSLGPGQQVAGRQLQGQILAQWLALGLLLIGALFYGLTGFGNAGAAKSKASGK